MSRPHAGGDPRPRRGACRPGRVGREGAASGRAGAASPPRHAHGTLALRAVLLAWSLTSERNTCEGFRAPNPQVSAPRACDDVLGAAHGPLTGRPTSSPAPCCRAPAPPRSSSGAARTFAAAPCRSLPCRWRKSDGAWMQRRRHRVVSRAHGGPLWRTACVACTPAGRATARRYGPVETDRAARAADASDTGVPPQCSAVHSSSCVSGRLASQRAVPRAAAARAPAKRAARALVQARVVGRGAGARAEMVCVRVFHARVPIPPFPALSALPCPSAWPSTFSLCVPSSSLSSSPPFLSLSSVSLHAVSSFLPPACPIPNPKNPNPYPARPSTRATIQWAEERKAARTEWPADQE